MSEHSFDALSAVTRDDAAVQAGFVNRVFGWMTAGLAITGLVAWAAYDYAPLHDLILGSRGTYTTLIILELVVVFVMTLAINKLSTAGAAACFLAFSLLNGLTLSWIFVIYDLNSLAATFFVTSGMFGAAGLYGYVTKRDLSGIGGIAFMALFGLIIASIVNIFWFNTMVDKLICYAGVVIFTALTAWDLQRIKQMSFAVADGRIEESVGRKYAIYGALELYLDFINLFLFLLRLFGGRK